MIAANLLEGIAVVLSTVLTIYMWVVIISALLTWVNPDPYNPIVRTLRNLTEPVYYRVRRTLPFVFVGGMDLSPLVVILAIQFLKIFLVKSLFQLAANMAV